MTKEYCTFIKEGLATLGIELGSTRIKCVLIDDHQQIIESGNFQWENQLKDGLWTYDINDVWSGIQKAYISLFEKVQNKYAVPIQSLKAIGISGMMHGYLVVDESGNLVTPFRTWRNTYTHEAAKELSEIFMLNIPERWSIAHLYHATLHQEEHVPKIAFMTTLSGYIHWKLTGKKVLGINDASGMFPINPKTNDFDSKMIQIFDKIVENHNFKFELNDILPQVLLAGSRAGQLTKEGTSLIDSSGHLEPGIPFCPPEGDAGTGMVATNTVKPRTGNVSAGTSIFAMFVLEKELKASYPEVDVVSTPDGRNVAMIHGNNCSTIINDWVSIFKDFSRRVNISISDDEIYNKLFESALEGDRDADNILTYGFYSGEFLAKVSDGRPLMVYSESSQLSLSNLMRSQLYSAFVILSFGMDILQKNEKMKIDRVLAHGGLFRTKLVAQKILSTVLNSKVSTMDSADEGGAWGIALLADYLSYAQEDVSLSDYLEKIVFKDLKSVEILPEENDVQGFREYLEQFKKALPLAREAHRYIE